MQRTGKFGGACHALDNYDEWCCLVQASLDQIENMVEQPGCLEDEGVDHTIPLPNHPYDHTQDTSAR